MKIEPDFVFEWGFRPFFTLSALSAIGFLAYWVLVLKGIVFTPEQISPADWHAHEMVFGFGGAALPGFLLTAIPECTGSSLLGGGGLGGYRAGWTGRGD
jgi:uncharacterized protein involved in response to NO